MSYGALLFIMLSLAAASALFLANTLIRAKLRRREDQLRRELPATDNEEQRPSTMPVREDAKADGNSSLWGLAGGGLVFFAILSWTGLGLLAALGGLVIYLIIAVPIALWLRARTLKRQSMDRPADDTSTH